MRAKNGLNFSADYTSIFVTRLLCFLFWCIWLDSCLADAEQGCVLLCVARQGPRPLVLMSDLLLVEVWRVALHVDQIWSRFSVQTATCIGITLVSCAAADLAALNGPQPGLRHRREISPAPI